MRAHLPVEQMTFPDLQRRVTLSSPRQAHGGPIVAVLTREGLAPYATAVIAAKRVYRAARWNGLFANVSACVGVFLTACLSSAGRTPLPCAVCNPTVKLPALFARAQEVGASLVATGHYARIGTGADGAPVLLRGRPRNDQAYMLARLPREWLGQIRFPLGGYEKPEVRALAEGFGLPVAHKADSMEICFIPDGDYAAWLERRGPTPPPGDFVDRDGTVLGRHRGIHHYTIGQRRGLGISAGQRLFVSSVDAARDRVVLSDGGDLMADTVWCSALNLLADLRDGAAVAVRLRHSKDETPATLRRTAEGGARLDLHTPARAPTPGQLAVFYDGDTVLGSGWIERCRRVGQKGGDTWS